MEPPRDPRAPDPEALRWLEHHLDADDAALIEALPDATVAAELHALALDPGRLSMPAASAPPRTDRAAVPPRRAAPRWRPLWSYAIASVVLLAVLSVPVLRSGREGEPAPKGTAAPAVQKSLPAAEAPAAPEAADAATAGTKALPPSPEAALATAQQARAGNADSAAVRAAISVLTGAYERASAGQRNTLAAALSNAHAALGDTTEARRWAALVHQP